MLGAAVAGLLGLYLAGAILAVGVARKAATKRAVVVTLAATAAITIGVLSLRSGDAGRSCAPSGSASAEDEFGNAASWNERLIYAYIGGRIFLDNPIVGTGWHGELPPDEYVRFLDDARALRPAGDLLPLRGGLHPAADLRPGALRARDRRRVLFLVPLRDRAHRGAGRPDWPRGDPDEPAAYLPAAWSPRSPAG